VRKAARVMAFALAAGRGIGAARVSDRRRGERKERSMNLVVWLPAMFALGLVSMGVCLVFALACEHI
jgi:hypothetical protein